MILLDFNKRILDYSLIDLIQLIILFYAVIIFLGILKYIIDSHK